MSYIVWLIAFVVFALMELVSFQLTTIWFAVGALVASGVSALGGGLVLQLVTFIVVSGVIMYFVRPFAIKFINNKTEKTNVESMVGKQGKVIQEINNISATGTVIIDGAEWTARSTNGDVIPVDVIVTVVSIEGVKAMVEKVK